MTFLHGCRSHDHRCTAAYLPAFHVNKQKYNIPVLTIAFFHFLMHQVGLCRKKGNDDTFFVHQHRLVAMRENPNFR